jgi:hypothetical protein
MSGLRNVAFLSLICFFAGAIIFAAGTDLQRRLAKPTPDEIVAARDLIDQLRAEVLAHEHPTVVHPARMPARKAGSYLSEGDKSHLQSFFGKLFKSGPQQPQVSPEDESSHVPTEKVAPGAAELPQESDPQEMQDLENPAPETQQE